MPTEKPNYSHEHVAAIRDQATSSGLNRLTCPCDGSTLEVYNAIGREVERGDQALQGVRYRGFEDVHRFSVECPKCRREAARIDLTGHGDPPGP